MTSRSQSNKLWILRKEMRADALVERRNKFIVELKSEGFTILEIGVLLNLHKTSVSRIVRYGRNTLVSKK